jgi:hypothetical protein
MYPHVHDALKRFLQPKTIEDVLLMSVADFAQLLLADEEPDYVARETEGLMTLWRTTRKLPTLLQGCATAANVSDAVKWMYIFSGRSLRCDLRLLRDEDACRMAAEEFRVGMADYQAHAIAWWERCKWTIVLGRGAREPTGMSIVLPVHKHVYEQIRDGKREGYAVSPDDLVAPSRHLVLQCTAERPAELCTEPGNYSKHTLPAIINQVAVLSYVRGKAARDPLTVLSFAATPRSRYRLEKAGYSPVGQRMPESGIELFEKKLLRGSLLSADIFLYPYLRGLGERSHEFPEPPLS